VKKAIIFAAGAFAVSLAGSTAIRVKTHHPAIVGGADSVSTGPDSLGGVSTRKDSVLSDSAPVDSTHAATSHKPDSSASPVHSDSAKPSGSQSEVPAASPAHARHAPVPVDPAAKAAAYKQVARVLAAMKPPEAVKVLELLSDEEVEGILRAVGPRQAADFLSNFPRERAASLSRRLLVPKPKEESR
jgi:hypothetical protein